MKIKLALASLFLFLSLGTPALAGGGYISLQEDATPYKNGIGFGRIVRIYLSPEIPCKGAEINLMFAEPKDGDYIGVGSPSLPYVMQEDRSTVYENNQKGSTCGTYAKVASKVSGDRVLKGSVKTSDGRFQETQVVLHMDNVDYGYGIGTDPFFQGTVAPKPVVKPAPVVKPTIKPTIKPTQKPEPSVQATPTLNPEVDQLKQRIDSLEGQLIESKQRQNFLEERVNILTSWIKSIFPFFK